MLFTSETDPGYADNAIDDVVLVNTHILNTHIPGIFMVCLAIGVSVLLRFASHPPVIVTPWQALHFWITGKKRRIKQKKTLMKGHLI